MSTRVHRIWQSVTSNVLRAICIALIVGTVLVLINHGDHIEQEPICDWFFLKVGLCYLVPFSVSMVSGVMAHRNSA